MCLVLTTITSIPVSQTIDYVSNVDLKFVPTFFNVASSFHLNTYDTTVISQSVLLSANMCMLTYYLLRFLSFSLHIRFYLWLPAL